MATQKKASITKKKKPVKKSRSKVETQTKVARKSVRKKVVAKKTPAKKKTPIKRKVANKKTVAKKVKNTGSKSKVKKNVVSKNKPKREKVAVKIINDNDVNVDNFLNSDTALLKSFSEKLNSEKFVKTKNISNYSEKNINKKINLKNKIRDKGSDSSHFLDSESENKKLTSFFRFRSFNLYRKIALSFIFLTFVLFISVLYFSFSSVTIILSPKIEHVSDSLIVDVHNDNKTSSKYSIGGVVERTEVEIKKTYQSTGKEIIKETLTGEVTIINNYSKDQPLVKRTRLLSSEGVLYRIGKTVTVPAGGSVKVPVYTDDPSKEKQLGLTTFTIPGLWAGLQDKIYAKNENPIIYKTESEQYVQQLDIDNAIKDIKIDLIKKVKDKFDVDNSDNIIVYKIEDNSFLVKDDVKIGEKVKEFDLTGSVVVQVVAFSNSKISNLARKKLLTSMQDQKELFNFNSKDIKYSLNNYDTKNKTASVKVSFSGEMKYVDGANIIDKNKIVGLTKQQLKAYLEGFDSFSNVEIIFSPSFIKKVPNLTDKIKIKIRN